MGLDSVEMMMAWEDAFGVAIPDHAAERMRTTRDVVDYLERQLPRNPAQPCGTQRAFHRLRTALIAVAGVPRPLVTPSSPARELLPADHAGEAWRGVGRMVGTPRWPRFPGRLGWHPTVRDLAGRVFRSDPTAFIDPSDGWSRGNIRAVVRAIVAEEAGLADDSFSDDASFHEDLGID